MPTLLVMLPSASWVRLVAAWEIPESRNNSGNRKMETRRLKLGDFLKSWPVRKAGNRLAHLTSFMRTHPYRKLLCWKSGKSTLAGALCLGVQFDVGDLSPFNARSGKRDCWQHVANEASSPANRAHF
jgi:hypothetical protein